MNVGLAHDYLLVMRGAERTFVAMADCWPGAPIHTTLHDEVAMAGHLSGHPVRTSPLQRLGVRQRGFRALLPLFPWAIERLDLSEHDVIVSSSSAFAHGVRGREDAIHVCYCHSPFRYAWHERERALDEVPSALRPVTGRALDRIRTWDCKAHARVTRHIANGRLTQRRLADFYGVEAPILHPPVDVDRFSPGEPEDWALVVGELVAHKRVDVALAAAARAEMPIRVVGEGPELPRWRVEYPHAEFLGRLDDARLAALYARARVLLVPAVEEFGITAVEAMAAGRPVVAPSAGGAAETVTHGETGLLLEDPDAEAMADVLRSVDFDAFDPRAARRSAERFAASRFRHRLVKLVGASTLRSS